MVSLSHKERRAAGVLSRKQCSRVALGKLHIDRCPSDPLRVLAASMQDRLPSLVPIKYERMAASAFGFFRGAACIMAADLAAHPHTGIFTQICGDAHVANLGAFSAQDGSLVFDINDFDETMQGPFEWDVKRFATSLLLAGKAARLDRDVRRCAVETFTKTYCSFMHRFAAMPVVELARFQVRRLAEVPPIPAIFREAQRSTPQRLLEKLTASQPARAENRCFRSAPPLQQVVSGIESDQVLASVNQYSLTLQPERRHFLEQYRPVQAAMRVVGTGSVGLRNYVVYFEGASRRSGADPLFLQIKQEPASAYAAYLPQSPDAPTHQGQRVLNGQRAMQLVSDPFLGYTSIDGRDYLVRQFNDHKASLDLEHLDAGTLRGYASLCGEILARGHARGGDPVAIAAYLGSGDRVQEAIYRFARSYSQKTRRDWQTLCRALQREKKNSGKLKRHEFPNAKAAA